MTLGRRITLLISAALLLSAGLLSVAPVRALDDRLAGVFGQDRRNEAVFLSTYQEHWEICGSVWFHREIHAPLCHYERRSRRIVAQATAAAAIVLFAVGWVAFDRRRDPARGAGLLVAAGGVAAAVVMLLWPLHAQASWEPDRPIRFAGKTYGTSFTMMCGGVLDPFANQRQPACANERAYQADAAIAVGLAGLLGGGLVARVFRRRSDERSPREAFDT